MPKTKKSSSKKYSSRTGKSGIRSNKFTTRSRNLDYKYHIAVRGDQFDFQRMRTIVGWNEGQLLSPGDMLLIPLSNYQYVAKSMRVTFKSNAAWAYAVFQNTPQLMAAFAQRLIPQHDYRANYKQSTGRECYVYDCGHEFNSIFSVPVTGGQNQDYASMVSLRDSNSFIVQLCKSQSTYGEVTSSSNSNLFQKTISVYNQKATQYLNGSSGRQNWFLKRSEYDPDYTQADGSAPADRFISEGWDQIFFANDMLLVIFPLSYVTPQALSVPLKGSIDVQRQIFELGQDADISTQLLKFNAPTREVTVIEYRNAPAQNTQGGKQQRQNTPFYSSSPLRPLRDSDIISEAQATNSITIDGATMYNPTTGCVEAEGYMDLNPVPDDGTRLSVELNTANANAFTYIGGSNLQLGNGVRGSDPADLLRVNTEFTGPQWIEAVDAATVGTVDPLNAQQMQGLYSYASIQFKDTALLDTCNFGPKIAIKLIERDGSLYWQHAPDQSGVCFDIIIQIVEDQQEPRYKHFEFTITCVGGQQIYYLEFEQLIQYLQINQIATLAQIQSESGYYDVAIDEIPIQIPNTANATYLSDLLIEKISWPLQASKAWGRIKKFLRKCWKFLKNAIPIGAKVISNVLPGPIGIGATIVADTVTSIDTAINAYAVSSKANEQFDTSGSQVTENDGQFVITPEYRVGSDAVDPTQDGTDWEEAEEMLVDVSNYAQASALTVSHKWKNHPYYKRLQQYKAMGINLGDATTKVQQRIKFKFSKAMNAQEAATYKAAFLLGSDTFYNDETQ